MRWIVKDIILLLINGIYYWLVGELLKWGVSMMPTGLFFVVLGIFLIFPIGFGMTMLSALAIGFNIIDNVEVGR